MSSVHFEDRRSAVELLQNACDVHRAIRDHFQKGGSAAAALLAICALLSLVALAYFLTEW